jgi:uncharacterized protein YbjT (DUF2867 family)
VTNKLNFGGLHFNVIGATGLVGQEFVKFLLTHSASAQVSKVTVFTRRPFPTQAPNLVNHIVDFEKLNHPSDGWRAKLEGDVLLSAMGTSLKQAKTKEEQYKVDYHHQMEVARAFKANGGKTMVLISAAGADARSPFFYVRMKGELERDIQKLDFERLRILRPSLLKGHRESARLGESVSDSILSALGRILPGGLPLSVKPIPASVVASAAFHAAIASHRGTLIYGPQDLWRLSAAQEEKP